MNIPTTHIIERTAKACGVSVGDILGRRRGGATALVARRMAMGLVCDLRPDLTFQIIGRVFRGRDHSTIMSANKKAIKERAENPAFAEKYDTIRADVLMWEPPAMPKEYALEAAE